MKKTLAALLVAGTVGLIGFNGCYVSCDVDKRDYSANKQYESSTGVYQFGKFSHMNFTDKMHTRRITQIEAADIDGDGDLDLIIGTSTGDVYMLENKIPQQEH